MLCSGDRCSLKLARGQGMSYIGALVLSFSDSEAEAFVVLANLFAQRFRAACGPLSLLLPHCVIAFCDMGRVAGTFPPFSRCARERSSGDGASSSCCSGRNALRWRATLTASSCRRTSSSRTGGSHFLPRPSRAPSPRAFSTASSWRESLSSCAVPSVRRFPLPPSPLPFPLPLALLYARCSEGVGPVQSHLIPFSVSDDRT